MFHRHKHYHHKKVQKTTELSLIRLIFAIGLAGIETIWAIYLSSFGLTESNIGFIAAGLIIVTFLTSYYISPILERISEYKLLILSLLIHVIAYLSISLSENLLVFILFSVILTIAAVIRIDAFDILFRDEAKDKTLNQEESIMFTFMNLGWLLGPLLAGFIFATWGISSVFISSALFLTVAIFILITLDIKVPKKKREFFDTNAKENFTSYLKNKKLHLPYIIASGIEIWWALIYIYIPLFIIKEGLGEEVVGIFLALIVVPLIMLEYETGKLSDKFGFKIFFTIGFGLLALASLSAFFLEDFTIILAILIFASFAMALIEPLQDSYFFRQVSNLEEEKYYPIFATAGDIGGFIGKLAIAGILLFFTQEYAFLIMAILMGIIALISLNIKE